MNAYQQQILATIEALRENQASPEYRPHSDPGGIRYDLYERLSLLTSEEDVCTLSLDEIAARAIEQVSKS